MCAGVGLLLQERFVELGVTETAALCRMHSGAGNMRKNSPPNVHQEYSLPKSNTRSRSKAKHQLLEGLLGYNGIPTVRNSKAHERERESMFRTFPTAHTHGLEMA